MLGVKMQDCLLVHKIPCFGAKSLRGVMVSGGLFICFEAAVEVCWRGVASLHEWWPAGNKSAGLYIW